MPELTDNALRLCQERYFKDGETCWPQVAERVSSWVCGDDQELRGTIEYLIGNFDFLPNSPTLMNAGTKLPQLSACFYVPIEEDSMGGIFQALAEMAEIQKAGGGTGFNFSVLREKNAEVSTTKGKASGPVSFMRVFNQGSKAVEQGGIRRGANMALLAIDHPDTPEFITYKADRNKKLEALNLLVSDPTYQELLDEAKELTYFNLSIAASDRFMQQVQDWVTHGQDSDWHFISRKTGQVHSTIKISWLWELIETQAWASGDPGIVFMDRVNSNNPIPSRRINGVNPCSEQPLREHESCNLGSINLSNMMNGPYVNFHRLTQATKAAVRFLDKVIDLNYYPLPKIEAATKRTRNIGLGVMGVADALYKAGIRYGSSQAVAWADSVMNYIQFIAKRESSTLAAEKGNFPDYMLSIYATEQIPMRNAARTTIAPTGSISLIANCSSGIEPNFSLAYSRMVRETGGNGSYQMHVVNPVLVDTLKSLNIYSDFLIEKIIANGGRVTGINEIPTEIQWVFVTAMELTPEEHLRMQAAFQRNIDNAVSKTINLPKSATPRDVGMAYLRAWQLGLKGVTVYRDGSLDTQVLNLIKDDPPKSEEPGFLVKIEGEWVAVEKEVYDGLGICPKCGERSYAHASGCDICYSCGYSGCKVS